MTANRWRVVLVAVSTALFISLSASTATALDRDDIIRLHEAGLDAGTIVNVIRSATTEIQMSEADLEHLESIGIPQPITSELRARLGFDVQRETAPVDRQRELAEQQRLEEERLRIERERMEAERQRLRQEIAVEDARAATVETEFRSLRRARAMVNRGDYIEGAVAFSRFLEEVQADPLSDEYYEALHGFVDAMHQAGLRFSIRDEATEVALMGATRRRFQESVRILRDVVREAGYSSPRIAALANQIVRDLPRSFQDEFNYFMGRYFYDAGELSQAISFLNNVDRGGDFGPRALFLTAVVLLNPEFGENIRAVETLQEAITSVEGQRGRQVDLEVLENSYLALARIAYQVGNFGGALYYYSKIPVNSRRWTTALFEGGWTYFLSNNFNRAIGNFHSLQSPFHNHHFYPDLYVLEAAAYLYTCNIESAHAAVERFEDEMGALRSQIREFMAEATDPNAFYQAVFEPELSRRQGLVLPRQAVATILSNIDFYNLYQLIQQLEREVEILAPAVSTLGDWGERALSRLESNLNNRRIEAGVLIHDSLRDLVDELEDWWFRAQEVKIDIGDLEARYLETILSSGVTSITEGTTLVIVADDWVYWPWEGEYWLDEVGSYRANLTTRCPDDIEF